MLDNDNAMEEERGKMRWNQRYWNLCGKTKLEKNHKAAHKSAILTEIIEEKRENLTFSLYNSIRLSLSSHSFTRTLNPNDSASSFMEIIKVTGYEITKLPFTFFSSFAGKKTFKLERF